MNEERTQGRAAFDEMALLYDQARPGYPGALFEDVVALSGSTSTALWAAPRACIHSPSFAGDMKSKLVRFDESIESQTTPRGAQLACSACMFRVL